MMRLFRSISAAIFVVSIASCGGGGGGGGGGSSSGRSARTGIRILHGAIDLSPLQVTSGGSTSQPVPVGSARFAEPALYAELNKGRQTIHLQPLSDTTADLLTSEIVVESGQHYSVLMTGTRSLGLHADIYLDEPPEIPSGMSALKVVNGLAGAAGIEVFDSTGSELAPATQFGRAGDYAFVKAGVATLNVARSSDSEAISSGQYELLPGKAYTLFVTGEIDYFVTARLLQD